MADVPPRYYNFAERLAWSDGYQKAGIDAILKARIPGCVDVKRADSKSDRQGTDYWATRIGLPPLSVDVKVRDTDFAVRGEDDLALETWSVVDKRPGWTRDAKKRTDYVLWYWQDTGRFFLASFPALCKVFASYWRAWRETYKRKVQQSDGWQSECVFVPRLVVIEKLSAWQCGVVPTAPKPY
jgi:hypothetical protein